MRGGCTRLAWASSAALASARVRGNDGSSPGRGCAAPGPGYRGEDVRRGNKTETLCFCSRLGVRISPVAVFSISFGGVIAAGLCSGRTASVRRHCLWCAVCAPRVRTGAGRSDKTEERLLSRASPNARPLFVPEHLRAKPCGSMRARTTRPWGRTARLRCVCLRSSTATAAADFFSRNPDSRRLSVLSEALTRSFSSPLDNVGWSFPTLSLRSYCRRPYPDLERPTYTAPRTLLKAQL